MDEWIEKKISTANSMVIAATLILGVYVGGFLRNKLPPQVPIFYSKPWGEEQLATPISLVIPFLLIILCGGLFLAVKRWVQDQILRRLVLGGTVVIEILVLLAVLRIVLLIS